MSNVKLQGMLFINENRIISPCKLVGTEIICQFFETFHDIFKARHIDFNVLDVRCDCYKPELIVILKQINILKHRLWIFCTEAQYINGFRIQIVSVDVIVEGISGIYKTFFNSIIEPFVKKKRECRFLNLNLLS